MKIKFINNTIIILLVFCFILSLPFVFSQSTQSTNQTKSEIGKLPQKNNAVIHLKKPVDEDGVDISGDGQFGTIDSPLRGKIFVQAVDIVNNPVPKVKINYKITAPTEKIEKPLELVVSHELTDSNGMFKSTCILGSDVGKYEIYFYPEDNFNNGIKYTLTAQRRDWGTFLLFGILGGLAIFLYGMQLGADGLQGIAGSKIRGIISDLTKNRLVALLSGITITFFTQSSNVTTAMLVSFVKARLLTLRQSIGMIFGAAVGATITIQLISLKITDYALPLIVFGFLLLVTVKNKHYKNIGKILLGFGLLFFGMTIMSDKVTPLRSLPAFKNAMEILSEHPVWTTIFAAAITALLQSSSATLGIVIALANQDLITLKMAIPIIFGANIGTTSTAILASIGAPTEAKRVAAAHFIYKVSSVVIFLPFIFALHYVGLHSSPSVARQIANTHTIFNGCIALLFLFFVPSFERLIEWLMPLKPDEGEKLRAKYLDLQILDTPPIAIGSAVREISRMARFVEEMMHHIIRLLTNKDEDLMDAIKERDEKVDKLQTYITHFLTNLTQRGLSEEDSAKCVSLLYIVNDIENIGDIIERNLSPLAEKMIENNLEFSEEGKEDIKDLHSRVLQDLNTVVVALTSFDEPLAQRVIDNMREFQRYGRKLHLKHLKRLSEGLQESIDTSSIHLDVINYLLRIKYHIYTIANSIKYKEKKREFQINGEE